MKQALILLDYINEIVHPDGKLAQKGYPQFLHKRGTINKINATLKRARNLQIPVLFVNLGFSENYSEVNRQSPIIGKAGELGILQRNTWSTEIFSEIEQDSSDYIIYKTRVSGFSSPDLINTLKSENISKIFLGGVATQLTVESTVRQAHDLDFSVTVLEDLCGTVSQDVHDISIAQMRVFGTVMSSEEAL